MDGEGHHCTAYTHVLHVIFPPYRELAIRQEICSLALAGGVPSPPHSSVHDESLPEDSVRAPAGVVLLFE